MTFVLLNCIGSDQITITYCKSTVYVIFSGSSGSERLCKESSQTGGGLDLMKSGGSTASESELCLAAQPPAMSKYTIFGVAILLKRL